MEEASGDILAVQQQEIELSPETIKAGIRQLFDMFNQLKEQYECDLTDDGGFAAVATGVKSRVDRIIHPNSHLPEWAYGQESGVRFAGVASSVAYDPLMFPQGTASFNSSILLDNGLKYVKEIQFRDDGKGTYLKYEEYTHTPSSTLGNILNKKTSFKPPKNSQAALDKSQDLLKSLVESGKKA